MHSQLLGTPSTVGELIGLLWEIYEADPHMPLYVDTGYHFFVPEVFDQGERIVISA